MPLPQNIQNILNDPKFLADVQLLGGSLAGGTAEKNQAVTRVEQVRDRLAEEIQKLGISLPGELNKYGPKELANFLMPFGAGQFVSAAEASGNIPAYGRESFANLFGNVKNFADYVIGGGQFENLNVPRTQLSTGGYSGGRTVPVPVGSTYKVNPQGIVLVRGAAGGTPQTQTMADITGTQPTKYYQFKGSPDVFDQNGNYISSAQAATIPNFFQNVIQLDYVRPEVKSASDFATYSGKPVSVSALTNPPPTPQGTTGTSGTQDYSSIISGAMTVLPTTTAEQTKVNETYQAIINKMKELEGQTAYQQSQEDIQGVTAKKAQLRDLQAQLTALNASTAATQANIEGRPMSMGAIVGQQGEVGRQNAIKALSLNAQINTLQGNIQTAQEAVNRMVDLKYAPIKTQLEELNVLLQQNRDALSKAEQKVADALKLQNDIKLKQLDIQIANEKNWETTVNTALANGAPISVITNARQLYAAKNEDKARALLAPYTGVKSNDVSAGGGTVGEQRDYTVSTYLNSKKGTDGYVAAETYQEALKKFIAKGGTQSNFFASFPQQTYLRQQEIDKLPAAMKPKTDTGYTATTIPANIKQSLMEDIKAGFPLDQLVKAYPEISPSFINSFKWDLGF
jgi:hypothetical protein